MLAVEQNDISIIKTLIPEIKMIHDTKTRDKIERIWAYAWRKSTWTNLSEVPYKIECPKISLVTHISTLIQICDAMATVQEKLKGIKLNRQLLYTLILLHDVCKLTEFEERDGKYVISDMGKQVQHGFFSAHLALQEGFSWDIIHLILTHTSQSKMSPSSIEGFLFRHIDGADEVISCQ